MKRTKSRKFQLTKRDQELFSYLFEVKIATASQIKRDVFKNTVKSIAYRRLKRLEENKYISRRSYINSAHRSVQVFQLTKYNLNKIIIGNMDKYEVRRCISDSIQHDLILNDIRNHFLKFKKVEDYFSENVLNSSASFVRTEEFNDFREKRCDGMVKIKTKDKVLNYAVEYEHTLKYRPF